MPGASVEVFVNGNSATEATANKAGSWIASVSLDTAFAGAYNEICAVITDSSGQSFETEMKSVYFNPAYNSLSKITVHVNGKEISLDFLEGSTTKPYYIIASSDDLPITFVAEFTPDSDITALGEVEIATRNEKGAYTRVPTAYDSEREAFIGSRIFSVADAPVAISAEYSGQTMDYTDAVENAQAMVDDEIEAALAFQKELGEGTC
jgi:hypothetical protein